MGSQWRVVTANPLPEAQRASLEHDLQQRLDALEQTFSHWRADSELSHFNAFQSTDWQSVSADIAAVAGLAQQVGKASQGALDITIAPLVQLWGFAPAKAGDPSPPTHVVPTQAAIADALQHCGSDRLQVQPSPAALRKLDAALTLNLSALVEGYAADQLGALLQARGVNDYLIDVGGEMLAHGHNPDGKPWQVGIQTPGARPGDAMTALPLSNQALATSGTYRQQFQHSGRSYSHIIDPRTGQPVAHRLVSVSVIHQRAALADAWATALLVLGPKEGRETASRLGLAAVFIESE